MEPSCTDQKFTRSSRFRFVRLTSSRQLRPRQASLMVRCVIGPGRLGSCFCAAHSVSSSVVSVVVGWLETLSRA